MVDPARTQSTPRAPRFWLPSESAIALAGVAVFVAVVGVGLWHHELWRDEMAAWLVARDAKSLPALYRALEYEGHPSIWYLLLWPLTRWPGTHTSMQLLHLLLAAAGAFVVLRLAPGPRWLRALWVLGYFPVYEYAVIAREYVLTQLVLAGLAWSFATRGSRPFLTGAFLAALPHTSPQGLILAAALWAFLAIEALVGRSRHGSRALRALAMSVASIGLAAWQIMPATDAVLFGGWNHTLDLARTYQVLDTVIFSWVPLPQFGPFYWETNLLYVALTPGLRAVIATALLAAASYVLARAGGRAVVACFLLCVAALLAFEYFRFVGSLRHHGFLWLTLGFASWMAADAPTRAPEGTRLWRIGAFGLAALLLVHVRAGGVALAGDLRYRFSAAGAMAEFISRAGLTALPLAGARDHTAMNVLGHLDGDRMFYLDGERFGSHVVYDGGRSLAPEGIWPAALRFAERAQGPVAVLTDLSVAREDPPPPGLKDRLTLLSCEESQVMPIESYCVFVLRPR